MRFVRTTYRIIRICLSKVLNKQFLIFLFFLGLSGAFWLFLALDEEYEIKMETRLQLQGMGQNVVITTEPPATLQFTLRDRGSTLLRYLYGRSLPPISIDFNQVANRSGHVRLPASELLRQLNSRLEPGTRIGSAQPDTVEFYFNYGLSKRVPVRLRQRFRAAKEYYVSSVDIEPDSVTVYAARPQLDTIYAAYVRPLRYRQFTDSAHLQLALRPEVGAKFVPDRVAVSFTVPDRPGALFDALEVFKAHSLNMKKLESRPIAGKPWEYSFFAELELSSMDKFDEALTQLKEQTSQLSVLGSYKSAH